MQCSLASIPLESGQQCQTLFNFEQIDSNEDSIGYNSSYPLWASNETLVFRRCTNLAGSLTCGIYASNSADGQSISRGDNAVPLNEDPTAIPSDTYGEWITYTSRQDGNWEAYVMSLDGTIIRNLSENAAFNDGLPTISPDGEWVAFVSDRSGEWAVWIVPITGGPSQKLFNLPAWAPWGNDGMAWINERITWGP
jgi:hypothetical protein